MSVLNNNYARIFNRDEVIEIEQNIPTDILGGDIVFQNMPDNQLDSYQSFAIRLLKRAVPQSHMIPRTRGEFEMYNDEIRDAFAHALVGAMSFIHNNPELYAYGSLAYTSNALGGVSSSGMQPAYIDAKIYDIPPSVEFYLYPLGGMNTKTNEILDPTAFYRPDTINLPINSLNLSAIIDTTATDFFKYSDPIYEYENGFQKYTQQLIFNPNLIIDYLPGLTINGDNINNKPDKVTTADGQEHTLGLPFLLDIDFATSNINISRGKMTGETDVVSYPIIYATPTQSGFMSATQADKLDKLESPKDFGIYQNISQAPNGFAGAYCEAKDSTDNKWYIYEGNTTSSSGEKVREVSGTTYISGEGDSTNNKKIVTQINEQTYQINKIQSDLEQTNVNEPDYVKGRENYYTKAEVYTKNEINELIKDTVIIYQTPYVPLRHIDIGNILRDSKGLKGARIYISLSINSTSFSFTGVKYENFWNGTGQNGTSGSGYKAVTFHISESSGLLDGWTTVRDTGEFNNNTGTTNTNGNIVIVNSNFPLKNE